MNALKDYIAALVVCQAAGNPNSVYQSYVEKATLCRSIDSLLEDDIPTIDLVQAVEELVNWGCVEVIRDEIAGSFYRFSLQKNQEFLSKNLQDTTSLIFRAAQVGQPLLKGALDHFLRQSEYPDKPLLDQPVGDVPASDRIVSLLDNSQDRDALIGGLDEIQEAIRGFNDERGSLTEIRPRVLAELESSKTLLKAPNLRVRAILTLLGGALSFLAAEFAGAMIGDLATQLLHALQTLIGM